MRLFSGGRGGYPVIFTLLRGYLGNGGRDHPVHLLSVLASLDLGFGPFTYRIGREAAGGNAIAEEAPTSIQRGKQMNLQQ